MDTKEYIARKILDFREERGLKQSELGDLLTPPKKAGTISSWETGRTTPDADTLLNLCVVLGVDISDFYPPSDGHVDTKLTQDERELLACYRETTDFGKRVVLEEAKKMSKQFPENEPDDVMSLRWNKNMTEDEFMDEVLRFYSKGIKSGLTDDEITAKINKATYAITQFPDGWKKTEDPFK